MGGPQVSEQYSGLKKMMEVAYAQAIEHGMSEEDAMNYCTGMADKAGYSQDETGQWAPKQNGFGGPKPPMPGQPPQPGMQISGPQQTPQPPTPPMGAPKPAMPPQPGMNPGMPKPPGPPVSGPQGPAPQPGMPPKKPEEEYQKQYALDTVNFSNVEIWSTGTYNGDTYTDADLSEMERNFAALSPIIKPYIKLGHAENQALLQADGLPSAGWITNLKKVGSKLYADFQNVPKKIGELIQAKAYGRFSPEIFWNLKQDGKIYRRVLSSVALLGADMPANGTLTDFINLYTQPTDADLRSYHRIQEDQMDKEQLEQLQAENANLKKQYAQLENSNFSKEVDVAWKSISGKKLLPKMEHAFKALCYADRSEKKEYGYTDKSGEQVLKYTSTFDLATKLIEQLPDLNFSALTKYADPSDIKTAGIDADGDELLDRKAREYKLGVESKGGKVSYKEALEVVSRGGN